uniref:Chloroplast-specific ribosome-associated protein n=1 Tax=Volvox carteri f. nagariensis TaxID=3068 RepID=Q5MCR1_VOLCA|nr:chloroplast-specific ribosome-associated protein [Volvox carteri f. nagariensis]
MALLLQQQVAHGLCKKRAVGPCGAVLHRPCVTPASTRPPSTFQSVEGLAPVVGAGRPSRSGFVVHAAAKTASTVRIIIQGRKLPVTNAIKEYVEEKVAKAIQNFAHTLKEVDVTLSARGGDTGTHGKKEQKVDVTIFTLRNGVVRVEDRESNLYAAIDLVCDKIRSKLTRVKEKAITKGKWPGKAGPKENVEGRRTSKSTSRCQVETQCLQGGRASEAVAELTATTQQRHAL